MILEFIIVIFFIFLFLFLFRKPEKHPPGPRGFPFIGNLLQFSSSATPHIYLRQLSEKFGALMSMQLGSIRVLVVSSADCAKEVLKTHDLTFCSRPKAFGQYKLSYNGLDVSFAPYGNSWRELRKICVLHRSPQQQNSGSIDHCRQVQSFRPVREAEVFSMMMKLSVSASAGEVINLSMIMVSLTSTLICRIAFGKRLDGGETTKIRFDDLMTESVAMLGGVFVSDYLPLFGWVDKVSGMIGRLDKVYKELDEFYKELIDEHMDVNTQNYGDPNNILHLLIQLKEQDSSLTWDHIKAILMVSTFSYFFLFFFLGKVYKIRSNH